MEFINVGYGTFLNNEHEESIILKKRLNNSMNNEFFEYLTTTKYEGGAHLLYFRSSNLSNAMKWDDISAKHLTGSNFARLKECKKL